MIDEEALRAQSVKLLDFQEAHVGFDRAVTGIPPRPRGDVPAGWEYSLWQLVEHLRIAQADILEFCDHASYHIGQIIALRRQLGIWKQRAA